MLPATYTVPELSLREYREAICEPMQVAHKDNVILPETFRYNTRQRLRSDATVDWAPGFVAAPETDAQPLPGSWFYLDNQKRGFGHVLSEQISHLWGWSIAKERDPSLRALVFQNRGRQLSQWEYDLFEAGGVPRDDLVLAEGPVRVESLICASPMFSMPAFVSPQIVETYQRIGDGLEPRARPGSWPRRIFVSRRLPKRRCHNRDEVERLFQDAGFEVIFPEDHPIADQVAYFRRAEVIAGFAGSGMFTMAFSGAPKHVILVSSESYEHTNEHMFSAVLGHRLDMVMCEPDAPIPRAERTRSRNHDNFTFDKDREGVFLQQILDDL
jgi:capsular polysaccharide biosynthesis protein